MGFLLTTIFGFAWVSSGRRCSRAPAGPEGAAEGPGGAGRRISGHDYQHGRRPLHGERPLLVHLASHEYEAYGVASITEDQSAYARYLGMIQMASAATLIAGMTKGAEFATAFSMSAAAIALLASIPGFEKLGTPKEPGAIWYVPRKEEGEESHHGITKLTHSLLLPSLPPLGSWAWVSSARRLGRA